MDIYWKLIKVDNVLANKNLISISTEVEIMPWMWIVNSRWNNILFSVLLKYILRDV